MMGRRTQWLAIALTILVAISLTGCGKKHAGQTGVADKFETVRAYIDDWLSDSHVDKLPLSSAYLKEKILDDWANQGQRYQIVSVRSADDFNNAGHIPHAINISWTGIIKDESLARLDPDKTQILYCYYGHASMISSTILSLLGYKCRSLDFGMMAWNLDAMIKTPWDREANYEVEMKANEPEKLYPPAVIRSNLSDAKGIVREMAARYFGGEGSPVIISADVKTIVDNWPQKKAEYQIVDVRSKSEYETGHVPYSINIPWAKIAEIENLKKLDPNRISIVYSENGQTGQMASTVLNLLGYRAVDMKFGMMDWNESCVEPSMQWISAAAYPIELSPQKR